MSYRSLVLLAACLVGVTACSSAAPVAAPTGAFLSVTTEQPTQVQLRRFGDGQVVKTLLTARGSDTVAATQAVDGSIVVAVSSTSHGCQGRIERLDPSTGKTTLLRTVSRTMSQISLSPDARLLAYVTYPSCSAATPPPCSQASPPCSGPNRYLPNVLGVLELRTGATVESATDNPGHPIFGLSWSPDSTRLALGYIGDPAGVLIVDPRPDLAHAPRVPAPRGCVYSAPAWTRHGIIVARTCTRPDGPSDSPGLDPDVLARVSPTGIVDTTWPLPACIDGISAVTDPTHTTVLASLNIGYGNEQCSRSWSTHLARIDASTMSTVLVSAQPFGESAPWSLAGA